MLLPLKRSEIGRSRKAQKSWLLRKTRPLGCSRGAPEPSIGALLLVIGAPHAAAPALPPRRRRRLECRDARRDAAVRPVCVICAWESRLSRLVVSFLVAMLCHLYLSPRWNKAGENHGSRGVRLDHHAPCRRFIACCVVLCAPLPQVRDERGVRHRWRRRR